MILMSPYQRLNIFMKLGSILVVTFVKVIQKFGCDQMNNSYQNALLLVAIKNIVKLNDLLFCPKWRNIFMKLKSLITVTLAKVIPKFGYGQMDISCDKRPRGLDALLIWWPVIKGLVIIFIKNRKQLCYMVTN